MRTSWRRGLALTAAAGLFLAGCGDDQASDEPTSDEQAASEAPSEEAGNEDAENEDAENEDVGSEDIEDGVYRGNGVSLPVPDGWSLDPAALQQGIVAVVPDDGSQRLTARAVDAEQVGAASGGVMDIESLLDGVRQQIQQEAETDEEVEVAGADQAHRLTYLEIPSQLEGQPATSATIVIAEGGDGLVGEFFYSAAAEDYDEDIASLLVDEAGFDPDSEPVEVPQVPQPAPSEDGATEEPADGTEEPADGTG